MNAQEFAYNQLVNLRADDPDTFGQMLITDEHSIRKVCYDLAKPQYKVSKEAGKLTYTAALKGLGMERAPKEPKKVTKPVAATVGNSGLTSEIRALIPQAIIATPTWSVQHVVDQIDVAWPGAYSVVKPNTKDARRAVYQHLARCRREYGMSAGEAVTVVFDEHANTLLNRLEAASK